MSVFLLYEMNVGKKKKIHNVCAAVKTATGIGHWKEKVTNYVEIWRICICGCKIYIAEGDLHTKVLFQTFTANSQQSAAKRGTKKDKHFDITASSVS